MSEIYVDQSASSLNLNLIDGELDKKNIDELKSKKYIFKDLIIESSIIGASHFVSFYFEGKIFSELFACLEYEDKKNILYFDNINNISKNVKKEINTSYNYEFSYENLTWNKKSQEKYSYFETSILAHEKEDDSISLSYTFNDKKQNKFLAKTMLLVYKINNDFIIESLHAYPNEEKIVFTKSIIKYQKETS